MRKKNNLTDAEEWRVINERFREKKLMMQILALLYALWLIVLIGVGIWMAASPAENYSLVMAGEELDHAAVGRFRGFIEVSFGRDQLTESAQTHPKGVFIAQYIGLFIARLPVLAALWKAAEIMEKIGTVENGLPYAVGELFSMAGMMIGAIWLRVIVPRLLTWIAGGGQAGMTLGSLLLLCGTLVAQAVFECLQMAFTYQQAQTEAPDEALQE